MKDTKTILNKSMNFQKTPKEEASTPNFSVEQKKVWAKVWAMLEASRLVTEPVNSSTSLYWMSQLIDNPHEKLIRATVDLTNRHKGYLTLGHLREAVAAQRGDWGAYKEFESLPSKPSDKETAQKHLKEIKKLLGM